MRTLLFSILICVNVNAMRYAKITGGTEYLIGKIVEIIGTAKETWGTNDLRKLRNIAARDYLILNPPLSGKIFYAKINNFGYFIHESWLETISE